MTEKLSVRAYIGVDPATGVYAYFDKKTLLALSYRWPGDNNMEAERMTERPIERVPVATGRELDALARHYGVEPRGTGEPDERLRYRIRSEIDNGRYVSPWDPQANSPSDAELSRVVADAIQAWKTARELPYLSPSACKLLNELIVAGLRPVLGGKR